MTECKEFFAQHEASRKTDGFKIGRELRLHSEKHQRPKGQPEKEFFRQKEQRVLDRAKVLVEWESQEASDSGNGPVRSGEMLRRSLTPTDFEGDHTDPKALVSRHAIGALEDLGLSVDRVSVWPDPLTSWDHHQAHLPAGSDRYLEFDVSWLRSMLAEFKELGATHQCFAVYDTPAEGNPAHAEGFLIAKVSSSKPYRDREMDLYDKLKEGANFWPKRPAANDYMAEAKATAEAKTSPAAE